MLVPLIGDQHKVDVASPPYWVLCVENAQANVPENRVDNRHCCLPSKLCHVAEYQLPKRDVRSPIINMNAILSIHPAIRLAPGTLGFRAGERTRLSPLNGVIVSPLSNSNIAYSKL